MIPEEAAKIIGRDVSHVRLLCRRGKIKFKRVLTLSRKRYVYDISFQEACRVRDMLQPRKGASL